jgi:hypothetical protein
MNGQWIPNGLSFDNIFTDMVGLFHIPVVLAGITFTTAVILVGFTVRQIRSAFGAVVQKEGRRSDSD